MVQGLLLNSQKCDILMKLLNSQLDVPSLTTGLRGSGSAIQLNRRALWDRVLLRRLAENVSCCSNLRLARDRLW